jgi:hypothetical protein
MHETIRRAIRSPRSRWLFIGSVVTLGLASRHTLPLHVGGPPYNAIVEVVRSAAAFYIAGLCVGFARASLNLKVDAAAIGVINGFFALVVSLLVSGRVHATPLEVCFGALLAAAATMLGAYAATTFIARRSQ